MIIKRFCAENFRNIEKCDIEFSSGVNLFYGNNAQGKTNAVEGIYIFARGKSFRSSEEKELLNFGKDGFRIYIEYEDKDSENSLEYAHFGKEKRRKKNGYNIKSVKEMIGNFRATLFYPDDLLLVKESPEVRRSFLNVAIGQIYNFYIENYQRYKNALENRNWLLKSASKGGYFDDCEFESWSYRLAEYSSYIYTQRKEYIKKLEVYADRVMREISDGKESLKLLYKSDIKEEKENIEDIKKEYYRIFTEEKDREKAVGTSLFGPHRDDMDILINGVSAKSYASQGQQRSIVLSLKLAEGEVCKEICGEYPVFLLDDVLSELDEKRKEYVMKKIGKRQIIITSCDEDSLKISADKVIEVREGKYNLCTCT